MSRRLQSDEAVTARPTLSSVDTPITDPRTPTERPIVGAYVIAELAHQLSGALAGGKGSTSAGRKLKRILARHGAVVLPSPRDASAALRSATIEVPDMESAHRLAAALRDVEGVETAYAKPGEELP
jgi:hypothetical protein